MYRTNAYSAPLLSNILPHLQTLVNFITNTLPKPVLVALFYRLTILQFASRILPTIGADAWESDDSTNDGWDGRPVRPPRSFCTQLTVRKCLADIDVDSLPADIPTTDICHGVLTSAACVSHMLCIPRLMFRTVLDPASQIWWRWANVMFTLLLWSVELVVSPDGDDVSTKWKLE